MISLPGIPLTSAQVAADLLSDDPPPTEAVTAMAGSSLKARRRDSRSARLTSTTYDEFGVNGLAVVRFTRTFDRRPGFSFTIIEAADNGASDVICRRYLKNTGTPEAPAWATWTDADEGVTPIVAAEVYGYRLNSRTPTLAPLTQLTLATFLFGTVNGLFETIRAAFSNQPTSSPIAAGTKFTTIAVASSQGPAA